MTASRSAPSTGSAGARAAAKEGELTFVSGNPGSTRRLYTVAQYLNERDTALPERLLDLAELRGMLTQYASESPEHARAATAELLSVENSYKGLRGRLEALTDPRSMPAKLAAEEKLRAQVKKNPALQKEAGAAGTSWPRRPRSTGRGRTEYAFIEGTSSSQPARCRPSSRAPG